MPRAARAVELAADNHGRREAVVRTLGPMSGSKPAPRFIRRPIVIIGALVLLALVGVIGYLVVGAGAEEAEEPQTPDPITTTLPVPSPAADPIEQDTSTALAQELPDVVLDHVLTAQEAQENEAADLGAFEVWALRYSAPGSDIEVQVLQWHDAEEAEQHLDELTEEPVGWVEGQGRRSGDVAVAGEAVGRYEIGAIQDAEQPEAPSTPEADADQAAGEDGTADRSDSAVPEPLGPGQALWRNGSVVFIASGDAARLALFYDNFPF